MLFTTMPLHGVKSCKLHYALNDIWLSGNKIVVNIGFNMHYTLHGILGSTRERRQKEMILKPRVQNLMIM
jgi:hypothetical protein